MTGTNLLRQFEASRLVGVNLSIAEPVDDWNPFDLLLERDSTVCVWLDVKAPSRGRRLAERTKARLRRAMRSRWSQ